MRIGDVALTFWRPLQIAIMNLFCSISAQKRAPFVVGEGPTFFTASPASGVASPLAWESLGQSWRN